jgi:hypothetical protein
VLEVIVVLYLFNLGQNLQVNQLGCRLDPQNYCIEANPEVAAGRQHFIQHSVAHWSWQIAVWLNPAPQVNFPAPCPHPPASIQPEGDSGRRQN